jgi:hypothetical protein
MAIQKPYDINIRGLTIDASEDNQITWKVSGAIQTSFSMQFVLNNTGETVIDTGILPSLTNKYFIPKGTLVNGREYKVKIKVFDSANNSSTSEYEVFQTSSRPNLEITVPNEINSQSYNFSVKYSQPENVRIKSWTGFLYDDMGNPVSNTGVKTSGNIEYLVSGMVSNRNYFIEFKATSEKGIVGTTGRLPFYVSYSKPNVYVNLSADNTDNAGIELNWNVIQIIGRTEGIPNFIESEKLNLRGDLLTFDEGFSLDRDFTLKIWLENPYYNMELVSLSGSTGRIYLQLWDDDTFRLFKEVNGYKSCYTTEPLEFAEQVVVIIQQVGDDLNILANEVNN